MLRNRTTSLALDCFIIYLKDIGDLTVKEASGYAKHKLMSKVDENEEALNNGVRYEPIDYEWMFKVFRPMYQEPAGVPIARIAKKIE